MAVFCIRNNDLKLRLLAYMRLNRLDNFKLNHLNLPCSPRIFAAGIKKSCRHSWPAGAPQETSIKEAIGVRGGNQTTPQSRRMS